MARYEILATDYDETLAIGGRVTAPTVDALAAVRAAGRRLVLVTGRRLDDLATVFPHLDLFHAVVGENGALLALPGRGERLLADAPPPRLEAELRRRGIPYIRGKVVVASWDPHGPEVARVVRELALPLSIILNKEAVMLLPPGVDKRSGLSAALAEVGASMRDTVAVGDAENDEGMLRSAGCGVAVANALPSVKAAADVVTARERGAGVEELARRMLADELPPPRSRDDSLRSS